MKIVRFSVDGGPIRCGILSEGTVRGVDAIDPLQAPMAKTLGEHRLADVRLHAPIARPHKYLAVGLNFPLHTAEAGIETPTWPKLFNKQSTCIIGPGEGIRRPAKYRTLDYEGELGVVIGKACRNVSEADALSVVGGYTIVNDVTLRELQVKSPTITLAKSGDTHGPVGPWLVTPDEIPDPQNLRVRTWVNDEQVQDFNTRDMIFSIAHIIAVLSDLFTLEPGDLIATGTGAGVGAARKPRRWLEVGQTVTVEVEGLGALTNPIVAEPDVAPPVELDLASAD